jgi:hypothetical protein
MEVLVASQSNGDQQGCVGPALHQRYALKEAVAAFEPVGNAEFLFGNQW